MMSGQSLCIGLSLATTWLTGNGWRRPDSRVEQICLSDFYVDIARRAEAAKLDFLFRPDSLFLDPTMLNQSPGISGLDPTLLLSALSRETSHIGLVTTASTTFNHPYHVARSIQSLHWLSKGRAGWNVVTALDGNENFGVDIMPDADSRYDRAAEFTEVVFRLWQSYPPEARVVDRQAGCYVETGRIRPIDHRGPFFSVKGPLNIPASDYGRIPILQAGASERGRDFAARIADAIFAATPDMEAGRELTDDIRSRARQAGRGPGAVKVLPGLSLFLAPTRQEAHALFEETQRGRDIARKHAFIREALGLDVSGMSEDQRITADLLPAMERPVRSRTHARLLRRLIERESPTLSELLKRPEVSGSAHWQVVGTPADAIDSIMAWVEAGAADGFVALPGGSEDCLNLFLGEVVPGLVERGVFRSEYSGPTFAHHLQLV